MDTTKLGKLRPSRPTGRLPGSGRTARELAATASGVSSRRLASSLPREPRHERSKRSGIGMPGMNRAIAPASAETVR